MIPMFTAIPWCCEVMLGGIHPTRRHDRKPFSEAASGMKAQAENPFGFKVVVIF